MGKEIRKKKRSRKKKERAKGTKNQRISRTTLEYEKGEEVGRKRINGRGTCSVI
jgi:hypothetical protein